MEMKQTFSRLRFLMATALMTLVCLTAYAVPYEYTYTYDSRSRLTAVSHQGGGQTYRYDAAGNLLALISPPVSAVNYALAVSLAGAGSGTVTGSGISCGTTCTATFSSGTSVTLTAAPGMGSSFTGWSGACSASTASCTVTMNAAQSVTATFAPGGAVYTDNGDGTVSDSTTGLTWMRCTMGQTLAGSSCTGTGTIFTWVQAIALTGTVSFAGRNDWRLPNIRELQTIVDRSVFSPAIDATAFPNTPRWNFWSASPYVYSSGSAWYVYFDDGYAAGELRSASYAARLVRGEPSVGLLGEARRTTDYVDHGNGTVTHTPTGLTWQRCSVGQDWVNGNCSGSASVFTWNAAKQLTSSFAGQTGWRLPTAEELLSLVDYSKSWPAINATVFPNTFSANYWSGSPSSYASSYAWNVNFSNGSPSGTDRVDSYRVRLVRPAISPVRAPGAPILNSVTRGPASATLNFSAPADTGDSPIASYTASCSASGQGTRTATGTGSPLTVRNMIGGVAYQCAVTATNAGGLTSGASISLPVTPTSGRKVSLTPILMLLLD